MNGTTRQIASFLDRERLGDFEDNEEASSPRPSRSKSGRSGDVSDAILLSRGKH
jgi:hypothetical protein